MGTIPSGEVGWIWNWNGICSKSMCNSNGSILQILYPTPKLETNEWTWITDEDRYRLDMYPATRLVYIACFKGTTRGLSGVFLPLVMNPLCPLKYYDRSITTPWSLLGEVSLVHSIASYWRMKGNITLHAHGLMVCHGQYNTLLWKESFRWLHNAAEPLDVPLRFIPFILISIPMTVQFWHF